MNHIQNIEIKNFKSIRHQKIEDCRRVNVFIGYPNVGKSNILEALSLFSVNSDTNISSFIRFGSLATLFFDGNIENSFSVSLNEKQQQVGFYQRDVVRVVHNYSKPNEILQNISLKSLNGRKYFELRNTKEVEFISPQIYESLYFPNILRYDFFKNVEYKEGVHDFLQMPYGENLFNVIYSNTNIKKDVQSLFKEYGLKLIYDLGLQTYSIIKDVRDGIFSIPYSMIADTLQRLIFYKTAIGSNENSILLFEEPEAHMFPPFISKLTSDVNYDIKNNQFFISTHSPFVINDFMENLRKDDYSIYIVGYDKETGETLVKRMTDNEIHEIYQYGVDLFLNLENYLPHAQQQ